MAESIKCILYMYKCMYSSDSNVTEFYSLDDEFPCVSMQGKIQMRYD